jgi:hypothetical protein
MYMNEWSEIDRGRKRCVVTHKRSSHVFVSHPLHNPQSGAMSFVLLRTSCIDIRHSAIACK